MTVREGIEAGRSPKCGDVLIRRLGRLKPRRWLVVGVNPLSLRYKDKPFMAPLDFPESEWDMYGVFDAEYEE